MRLTDDEVVKLARRAAAHTAAGVEEVEIFAPVFEKAMWELILLRKQVARLEASQEERTLVDADPARFPNAARLLEGNIPEYVNPKHDVTQAIGTGFMGRTCPGTIKAIREDNEHNRFSLPEDNQ